MPHWDSLCLATGNGKLFKIKHIFLPSCFRLSMRTIQINISRKLTTMGKSSFITTLHLLILLSDFKVCLWNDVFHGPFWKISGREVGVIAIFFFLNSGILLNKMNKLDSSRGLCMDYGTQVTVKASCFYICSQRFA